MAERHNQVSDTQIQWELVQTTAIRHGLASSNDTKTGPVAFVEELELYMAFTEVSLTEIRSIPQQQLDAKFAWRA